MLQPYLYGFGQETLDQELTDQNTATAGGRVIVFES